MRSKLAAEAAVASRLLRFAPGFGHVPQRGAPGLVRGPATEIPLPPISLALERHIASLPVAANSLVTAAEAEGSYAAEAITLMSELGAVEEAVVDCAGTVLAVAHRPRLIDRQDEGADRLELREDVFIRPDRQRWLVASASARTYVTLARNVVARVLDELSLPRHAHALSAIGALLADQGFLVPEGEVADRSWCFHDALFHAASVHGAGTTGGYGRRDLAGGYSAATRADRSDPVELPPPLPDPEDAFIEVLARRRTRRRFAPEPVTLAQLESVLRLALRPLPGAQEVGPLFHPYASGGALGEVMPIVASRNEEGGASLVARYEGCQHELDRLSVPLGTAEAVIATLASVASIPPPLPSAALLFAADYQRMADRYEAIAYATILRNMGAIYQTVSLSAEALGLASCCLGGGWGDLERKTLASQLGGRVLVGAMVLGVPERMT